MEIFLQCFFTVFNAFSPSRSSPSIPAVENKKSFTLKKLKWKLCMFVHMQVHMCRVNLHMYAGAHGAQRIDNLECYPQEH